MIDNIILNMDFNLQAEGIEEIITKEKLCKSNEIDIDGIKVRIKLKEEDFYDFKEKLIVDTKEGFVPKD